MKTTLDWYKREANSFSRIATRQIIKKWEYKGAFLYVAICDTLVTLPNCVLDVKNDLNTIELLCLDVDFEEGKFTDYLNDLLKYKLLVEIGDFQYSTQEIQESLVITMEERVKSYVRKYGKQPNYMGINDLDESSGELSNSSGELSNSSGDMGGELSNSSGELFTEREEKHEKPEKQEKLEITKFSKSVFNKEFLVDLKDIFDINEGLAEKYQKSFLKFFKIAKKEWKTEENFRTHFLNWLKKEIEKENKSEKPKKVGAKRDY